VFHIVRSKVKAHLILLFWK